MWQELGARSLERAGMSGPMLIPAETAVTFWSTVQHSLSHRHARCVCTKIPYEEVTLHELVVRDVVTDSWMTGGVEGLGMRLP